MVLKGPSVLSCLLPARFAFGSNHRVEPTSHGRDQEKLAEDTHTARLVAHDRLGEHESDPFGGNPPPVYRGVGLDARTDPPDRSRARANTMTDSLPPRLLIPNGDVRQLPSPIPRSLVPPVRPKRSSFTNFFAFSSKRRSSQGPPIHQPDLLAPPQSVSVPDGSQSEAHLVNPSSIPSPLLADEEEYYYSYYASLTPTFPPHPASPHPDSTNVSLTRRLSARQQDIAGNTDLDSSHSSPVASRSPHTQMQHPYVYSSPLYSKSYSKIIVTAPTLRHATSQPLQPRSPTSHTDIGSGIRAPHLGHELSSSKQPLKTSMSTPNLASGAASVRPRSFIRKRPPTRPKGQERWLSAETWWDALFSPSPRFKVKQAPRPHTASGRIVRDVRTPVGVESSRTLGSTTVSSLPTARPRAVSISSVASNVRPTPPGLTRSRSAADLIGQPSTSAIPRAVFEPALETLVDVPTPPPDQAPGSDAEAPTSDPFLSLDQVLDEGEAFEQQRAEWKRQAARSLGNKHTRSFSRARSKSLGEKQTHGHLPSESHKSQFNLEFLAARTLLGSQSTMPTVHVTKPSNSSSHSKAYSHSHSHSAYSFNRASHSHAHSHSHSHSLTTSNSSKSSRNYPHRGHSRNGSWSRTAFLKAGALCGIVQGESYSGEEDEQVPSSSRVDIQGTVHVGVTNAEGVQDAAKTSPTPPIGEVGIAVTSLTPSEARFDFSMPGHPYVSAPQHEEADQQNRWSSKYTTKSSEYAGPHPSAIDSNLPQLGVASNVSLRHRLPPRPAIHPPIAPIAHPYQSASGQLEQAGSMRSDTTASKVDEGCVATEQGTERAGYPHLSLSHADFEQYGVGEALVYASLPQPASEAKRTDVENNSLPASESLPEAQPPSPETVAQPTEELDTSSLAMNSPPSVTNSTIQMVMSAFDNPDDLDEFQDLFYRPSDQDPSIPVGQMSPNVHGSEASSPLSYLVRKLSEEVQSLRDPSRTPSDPMLLRRSESHDYPSSESGTKFVFSDLARTSSPPPMESSSLMHLPSPKGSESTSQPVMIISEDFGSSYTTSALDTSLGDPENDTFGYPIKRGQLEVAIAPSPIQSPSRLSTHLSIQEEDFAEDDTAFLSPVTKRYGLSSPTDIVRSSYMTTSDMSQMSELSDFPLPPSVRPAGQFGRMSTLHTYLEASSSSSFESQSHGQREDRPENEQTDNHTEIRMEGGPSADVLEALRVLRATPRVTSYQSDQTFGGSDDMEPLHQAGP
ncbi:hypothetical protein JVU11DRAFT_9995 [Chiua virens]|nr:hypothetical protein JVU11DRAFT_9995 [Chiua virens]